MYIYIYKKKDKVFLIIKSVHQNQYVIIINCITLYCYTLTNVKIFGHLLNKDPKLKKKKNKNHCQSKQL